MNEMLFQGFAMILAGAVVWGGIRADIKNQRDSIARAHKRIDDHLTEHLHIRK